MEGKPAGSSRVSGFAATFRRFTRSFSPTSGLDMQGKASHYQCPSGRNSTQTVLADRVEKVEQVLLG
jgi:hypothetical protein